MSARHMNTGRRKDRHEVSVLHQRHEADPGGGAGEASGLGTAWGKDKDSV